MITKTAKIVDNFKKELFYYNSAREAFENILNEYKKKEDVTLLLPGYIGVSPNEGSGIFDPVISSGIKYRFYRMNKDLSVNSVEFRNLILSIENRPIVLLVHYFGYIDNNIKYLVDECRRHNAVIIEDAAHALYTDYVDHACGYYGDYVLYSLHKMFPFNNGGMLKINCGLEINITGERYFTVSPFSYDLQGISKKRKDNAKLWNELLIGHEESIGILRPYSDNETSQTFPIIINNYDRNMLYFALNSAGYGAVSLYHTMIDQIKNNSVHEDAVWLSKHIINMPVHQDVDAEEIEKMAEFMLSVVEGEKCL